VDFLETGSWKLGAGEDGWFRTLQAYVKPSPSLRGKWWGTRL